MSTLVIHPNDNTTEFLTPVWKGRSDWTVVRSNSTSKADLRRLIKQNDRIICMGHGSEQGLFRVGKFNSLMIDSTFVQMLREKDCVFVWCNADVFFEKYNLKGFYTGMIISDADEALYCCVPFASGDVSKANDKLKKALSDAITQDSKSMYFLVKENFTPETGIEKFR